MKKWVSLLLALSLLLGVMTVSASAAVFTDVAQDFWCHQEVSDLVDAGVIGGYGDGTYRPNNPVTCGAALKLVLLAAGYGTQAPTGSNVFSGYYDYALQKGFLAKGEMTDLGAAATRLQIARLTARALKLPASSLATPYADTSDGYAVALYTTGIMQGTVRNGKAVLNASAGIKRGEMAAVVWRILYTDWRSISRQNSGQIAFGSKWYDILRDVPVNSHPASGFYTGADGNVQFTSGDVRAARGIDVSSHQGTVDWNAVAASGVEFVILRAGYRGYTTGAVLEDAAFRANLQGAMNAGLRVGVYFYSQAITVEEAAEEARFVLNLVQGMSLPYPIVFDWETVSSSSARTNGLGKDVLTACANTFCDTVESAGYRSAVYFNLNLAYTRYDLSGLNGRTCWLAEYNVPPTYYYDYQLLQYTSSGTVPGISGRVDMNLCMVSF